MTRYGMVIDTFRCVRCHGCMVACKAENGTPAGVFWQTVIDTEEGKYPNAQRRFLPRPCMHCDNPPCVTICPTGASYKREDGIVMVDYDKCIGCKYCITACPYGVRHFMDKIEGYFPEVGFTPLEEQEYKTHRLNVVEKCTFCAHRVDDASTKGLKPGVDRDATPACVITCPANALIFGDLDNPDSEVSKAARLAKALLPAAGTSPKVFYTGPIPEDVEVSLQKEAQVVSPSLLSSLKDVMKPGLGVLAGAVAVVALVNLAKSRREEVESEGEVK